MKEKWRFLDKPAEDAVAKHLFNKLHKETWHITQKPKGKFLSGITLLNQSINQITQGMPLAQHTSA